MALCEDDIIRMLDANHIDYELVRHPPVFSSSDDIEGFPQDAFKCKSLFVVDGKLRHRALVLVEANARADLRGIRDILGCGRLSIASQDELERSLGVASGSVTPFALLQASYPTPFFVDHDLLGHVIGIHPMHNASTVFLEMQDLLDLLARQGVDIRTI